MASKLFNDNNFVDQDILTCGTARTCHSKCIHKIKKCRKCVITPIFTKKGEIVSFITEHCTKQGKCLDVKLGMKGVRLTQSEQFLYNKQLCKPEMDQYADASYEADVDAAVQRGSDIGENAENEDIGLYDDSTLEEPTKDKSYKRCEFVFSENAKQFYESQVKSETPEAERGDHLKTTTGEQLDEVQKKLLKHYPSSTIRKGSKLLEQLILLVVGLQYDTRLEAVVTRCISFLSAICDDGIVMYLKDILLNYCKGIPKIGELENASMKEIHKMEQASKNTPEMDIKTVPKVFEALKKGAFTKHLSYVLGTVFAVSACRISNVEFDHPMYKKVIEHSKVDSINALDLIEHSIKLYNWVSTVGVACIKARSIQPMILNSSTLADCHRDYYKWKEAYALYQLEGNSTMEERQKLYIGVELLKDQLKQFCALQRDSYTSLQASSLHTQVLQLFLDVKTFVQKVDVVKTPFALHLHGPPKVGKSTVTSMIHEQVCVARGVEYRSEDNAQVSFAAKFLDSIGNSTQCVTANELLPTKEAFSQQAESSYTTALAIVDNVPFHPNRSNLEDKEKVTFQGVSVVSNANTERPYAGIAKSAGAWERRYLSASVRVQPAFADHHGRLVSAKCDGSENYNLFDVYEIIIDENNKTIREYFKFELPNGESIESKGIDTAQFLELVRHLALRHFAEQDKLEIARKQEKKKACLVCKRVANFCKCPSPEECTMAEAKKTFVRSDVNSMCPKDKACAARSTFAGFHVPCDYNDEDCCVFCGECKPVKKNDPEMGVVSAIAATGAQLVWESAVTWLNPFVRMKHFWSLDNSTTQYWREEIIEEISAWPDALGCKAMSLIPESWETRADGSKSFIGKRKEDFVKLLAAEKQLVAPLSYYMRRAFTWALALALLMTIIQFGLEYFDIINYRAYEEVIWETEYKRSFSWIPMFPQWSAEVFERREYYQDIGIVTRNHAFWENFYIDLYWYQKLLGMIFYPGWPLRAHRVAFLELRTLPWWEVPLCTFLFWLPSMFLYMWLKRAIGYQERYKQLQEKCAADKELQHQLHVKCTRHWSEYNEYLPTAIGVLGVIVTGLAIWNQIRTRPEGDIDRSDNTKSWSDFFSFSRVIPKAAQAMNASDTETVRIIQKNMCSVKASLNGVERRIMGVYMETGVLLLPRHFFKPDPMKEDTVEFLDLLLNCNGVKHSVRAYINATVRIQEKDCCLLFVPKAPKMKRKICDLLPMKTGSDNHRCNILHFKDGQFITEKSTAKYIDNVDCGGFNVGRGQTYVSRYTGDGSCGTPIVSDRHDGVILGFHISGNVRSLDTRYGFSQEVLYDQYIIAKDALMAKPGAIKCPEMATIATERYGVKFIQNPGPHPKTKVFEDPEYNEYCGNQILGHTLDLPKYRSRVRRSMLSKKIEEKANIRNKWKAPYMKEPWKHHNTALIHNSKGAREVPPEALEWAVNDYLKPLLEKVQGYKNLFPHLCKKLTMWEMVNGIEDSIYMKCVVMSTSVGPPLNGSKMMSDLFEEDDPSLDGKKYWRLTKMGIDYFVAMYESFKAGEKYGVWAKTCLKDEVVAEESEKVRIFYILEALFALMVRQYYLPVCEFLSRHPLLAECAVGINCASPEWDVMQEYVKELCDDDMMVDWDYSKYDLKRSPDVMIASLNIMKRLCAEFGYDEVEQHIMEMMADELRNPVINWNGTMLMIFLWTSGNTLTVYGNSIENSLHQRISFYINGMKKYGKEGFEKLGCFRDNERIMTYGDDGLSGCRKEVRDICGFSSKWEYFNSIDMKITDAAKSSDPQEFTHSSDLDFLKRKSVWHPELGVHVGALDFNSIWKMLHMHSGSGELEDLAVSSIISALGESFLHGEEKYEELRKLLREICAELNIWTDYLDYNYLERVDMWKEKYMPDTSSQTN